MIEERWRVLALLFLIRTVMAYQFGTVGALGPTLGQTFHIDAAGIGLLVGLYLSPGLFFALPGGAIGRYLGDKRAVLFGLALMTLGGAISAFGATWNEQLVGRVLAGTGGVILNVLMSKMVTDHFEGREIATAMAIFVNSWPCGIGLALLAQPHVSGLVGISGAFALTSILAAISFFSLLMLYRPAKTAQVSGGTFPRGNGLILILIAGCIFAQFNVAFSMIFSFVPLLLTGRGWDLASASSAASIAVWSSALVTPFGGMIADRTGRPNTVMVVGLFLTSAAITAIPRFEPVLATLIIAGLLSGLPVGTIMSLPARALSASNRAIGMGLFFIINYLFTFIAPAIGGALIGATGWDGAAIDLGAAMLVAAIGLLALFERLAKPA